MPLTDSNRGLINPFTQTQATAIQQHDLLNFRLIGEKEYLLRVASVILKQPSVHAPNKKKRLQTFSEQKVNKRALSQVERDKKLILAAMKKKIQFSKKTGKPIETTGEQLVEYPLAIADNIGQPLKGQKSYTTRSLETRYKAANPQVFVNSLPWVPQCSVLEGMFLINTVPLGTHKTLADYARFLMSRYIMTQFNKGSHEVHVIFDNPGRLPNTPKSFEQARRDKTAKVVDNHHCDEMISTTTLPKRWRENLIHCRTCKRALVKFLTQYFQTNICMFLQPNQTLYVAGAFEDQISDTAWYVSKNSQPQPDPKYTCNAEEADTRVWLHIRHTTHMRLLLMSPDTDVYHIGLGLNMSDKHVMVQISPVNSREIRFLDFRALNIALQNDPDLATVPSPILPLVIQTLFVCTGCDYISFFSQLGKATFLRYLFQHASFITSGQPKGTLADTSLHGDIYKQGFLAFMRLIGTIYYKKHATAFETPTPATHFIKFAKPEKTVQQQHTDWLEDIRQNIWDRIKYENEMIPSNEALFLHWQRSCWVIHMWRQADLNNMVLQPITSYGWALTNQELCIVWDTPDNMAAIRHRVSLLLRGCKCTTGCSTGRCSCKRNKRHCYEGCQCKNCSNLPCRTEEPTQLAELALEEEIGCRSDSDDDIEDLIDWIFGSSELMNSDNDTDNDTDSDRDDIAYT